MTIEPHTCARLSHQGIKQETSVATSRASWRPGRTPLTLCHLDWNSQSGTEFTLHNVKSSPELQIAKSNRRTQQPGICHYSTLIGSGQVLVNPNYSPDKQPSTSPDTMPCTPVSDSRRKNLQIARGPSLTLEKKYSFDRPPLSSASRFPGELILHLYIESLVGSTPHPTRKVSRIREEDTGFVVSCSRPAESSLLSLAGPVLLRLTGARFGMSRLRENMWRWPRGRGAETGRNFVRIFWSTRGIYLHEA